MTRIGYAQALCVTLLATGCTAPQPAEPSFHEAARPYAVVRFAPDAVPTVDGDLADWQGVPHRYWIGTGEMFLNKPKQSSDDLRVCVGYCAETGRVYFAVRVRDDYLKTDRQHSDPERYYPFHDDVFEVVVDADTTGGSYIRFKNKTRDENRKLCGCHAQNYHVYLVSPRGRDHAWLWGDQKWLLDKPYADFADRHTGTNHAPAEVTLEFYVTPFNYAATAGPALSAKAPLVPGQKIGIGWLRCDEDGPDEAHRRKGDEYYFGRHIRLYGNADHCFEVTLDRDVLRPAPPPSRTPAGPDPVQD